MWNFARLASFGGALAAFLVLATSDDVFARLRSQQRMPQLSDLAPTPVREVLARCCRSLTKHYIAAGDTTRARLFAGFVHDFEAAYERHAQS